MLWNGTIPDTSKNLNTRIAPIDRSRLAEQRNMYETVIDCLAAENNWLTVDKVFVLGAHGP